MHGRDKIVTLVSVIGLLACEPGDTEGVAGAGSGGRPGTGGTAGMTGSGGALGAACPAAGSGSVVIQTSGLPASIAPSLIVTGPEGDTAVTGATLRDLAAGPYTVAAARVADIDPLVRTVYDVTLEESEFCLIDAETYTIELTYAPVPTSHKLWTDNANGTGNLLGFAAESLSATANAEPALPVGAGAGKDVTFDAEGNLWSMGGTLAEPHLMRFSSGSLGAAGDKMPDRGINLEGVVCLPAMRAFAFDPSGSLWVSTCGGQLFALSPVQLEESGDVSRPAAITGLIDNGDLAFDALGNLWVIDEGKVLRFDVERLDEPTAMPSDLAITIRDQNDTADLTASNLAFDAAGNLWIIDFGGNLVAQLAAAELTGTGTSAVISSVVVAIGVSALLERPAFDESLGLWLALDQGRFGRLAPAQLLVGSTPGAPTIPDILITSTAIGNANRMAFYPAAASLPLYHRFR